jgi:hypothetical protein
MYLNLHSSYYENVKLLAMSFVSILQWGNVHKASDMATWLLGIGYCSEITKII